MYLFFKYYFPIVKDCCILASYFIFVTLQDIIYCYFFYLYTLYISYSIKLSTLYHSFTFVIRIIHLVIIMFSEFMYCFDGTFINLPIFLQIINTFILASNKFIICCIINNHQLQNTYCYNLLCK